MPIIELGLRPDLLRVKLLTGSPFYTEMHIFDQTESFDVPPILSFPLPDGSSIEWSASVSTETPHIAIFDFTPEQVDELITSSKTRTAVLKYDEFTWATGRFEVLDD